MFRNLIITLFTVLIFLTAKTGFSQFFDDFNDGQIPLEWEGQTDRFKVNALNQLQLDAPAQQDSTWISRPSSIIDEAEWQIWVKLDFASSNNNRVSIYLVSDEENLTGPLNGYFLRIGENGSDVAIELYRQTGYTKTLLGRGTDGLFATSFSSRIKVFRDATGNWEVSVDSTGSNFFTEEFIVQDDTHKSTVHFGMVCYYTSTRSALFFFDDIYAGTPIVDTVAPEIENVVARSATELEVYFSEGVEETTANAVSNYFVGSGIGNPISAQRDPTNFSKVLLTFANPFPTDGTTLTLTVNSVEDASGNAIVNTTFPFSFYVAAFNDIIITEILPRTTPQVGLPAHQFVELYNRSGRDINVYGWTFSDRTSTTWLPDVTIPADSFLLLTTNSGLSAYAQYGTAVGLSPWPSLNLTSDDLTLRNTDGGLIFFLAYSSSWYGDSQKSSEGWSLEMIDINNPCGGQDNWTASIDPSGGTPGRENSVAFSNPDITAPILIRAFVQSPTEIVLYFTETIDSLSASDIMNYLIDQNIGNPLSAVAISPAFTEVLITLDADLATGITYEIAVTGLTDCSGNVIEDDNTARFGIPESVEPFDVVINELLYYPVTGGSRFMELYNRSEKVINLQDLRILRIDPADGVTTVGNPATASTEPFLIFPGEYIVLTPDGDNLEKQYFIPSRHNVIDVSSFPAYPNNEGIAELRNYEAKVIDRLHYFSSWHFDLVSNRGVSLERRDFDRPTQDENNWYSAASTVGYATPGYQNSQYLEFSVAEEGITIDPEVFSPDGDGHQDLLNIKYSFNDPGYLGSITIYDDQGRTVRRLVKNKLLDLDGVITWDGINEIGEKSTIGIYVIVAEIFNLNGTVKTYKKSAVLAGRL